MKKNIALFALVLLASYLPAQQLPTGTWSLLSGKGLDTDGKPFAFDRSTVREWKIITPTHYMIIRNDVKNDSVKFAWSIAGRVKFEGNRYYEYFEHGSEPPLDTKTDFTYKMNGNRFIQSGIITFKDGKKVVLDELVFERMNGTPIDNKYPGLGVWDQLSSKYKMFDGTEGSHTNATATRFEIVTPTHWMRMNIRDNKFENVMGGSYKINGKKIDRTFEFSSIPMRFDGQTLTIEEDVKGDKRYVKGRISAPDGKTMWWDDVFVRVGKI